MFDRKTYMKEYDKKKYSENREREIQRATDYYDKHKDDVLAKKRRFYLENSKRLKMAKNTWYDTNKQEIRTKQTAYAKRHPAIIISIQLKNKFGITLKDYRNLLRKQCYGCAICGLGYRESQRLYSRRLCVDHCHATNKVRGLLCDHCNSGLGRFKDNEFYLRAAIQYLKKSKKEQ